MHAAMHYTCIDPITDYRRVFNSVSNELMLVADMPLSAQQVLMAARTAKARAQRVEKSQYMADCAVEFRAYIRRRDLLHRTAAQKATTNPNPDPNPNPRQLQPEPMPEPMPEPQHIEMGEC